MRIASTVQRQIAEILRNDYSDDPVLRGVSVVDAESHGGLQFVRVWYYIRDIARATPLGGGTHFAQKRLDAVKPAIRRELARRMNQKYVPDIRFVYDDTQERGDRIDELLTNIEKG